MKISNSEIHSVFFPPMSKIYFSLKLILKHPIAGIITSVKMSVVKIAGQVCSGYLNGNQTSIQTGTVVSTSVRRYLTCGQRYISPVLTYFCSPESP